MNARLLQIDLLKGLAIISVIILHLLPTNILVSSFAIFHIWQAVPIFLILMGFTSGLSFKRKEFTKLREIYTRDYFISRLYRFGFPFVLLVFLVGGPGSYFILIIFEFILLFPLMYLAYKRSPVGLLVASLLLELAFKLLAPFIFTTPSFIYGASIFRYLFVIALGLWLVDHRNTSLTILAPVSILYLMAAKYGLTIPYFLPAFQSQNFIAAFYPLLLVVLGLRHLPSISKGRAVLSLARVGNLSYYIFVAQVLVFGLGFNRVVYKVVSYIP